MEQDLLPVWLGCVRFEIVDLGDELSDPGSGDSAPAGDEPAGAEAPRETDRP